MERWGASRWPAVLMGIAGFVVIAGYALAGVMQALVWNPMAAAPGLTQDEIHSAMANAGESLFESLVQAWGGIGVVLATGILGAALLGVLRSATRVAAFDLAVLVLGAPSHWYAAFPAGMSVADAFNTRGGDHAPWGGLLYVVSGAAAVVLLFMVLGRRRRDLLSGS